MIDERFYRADPDDIGVKGLVFIGEKLLIYRRDNNAPKYPMMLDVPGGGKEGNETPFETFKRELKEEFGLDIILENIIYARRYASIYDIGKFGWYTVARLTAEQEGKIEFGNEGTEFMLMEPSEYLSQTDVWPVYQQRARDYFTSLT